MKQMPSLKQLERFLDRFEPDDYGCLIWTGPKTPQGYGIFGWKTPITIAGIKIQTAHNSTTHTLMYALEYGRWVKGDVLHTCDVKACGEPTHLYEGDHVQNMRNAIDRGQWKVTKQRGGNMNPLGLNGR